MNLHGKDIKIFSANANPAVAEHIAKVLGLPHGPKCDVSHFLTVRSPFPSTSRFAVPTYL